MSKMFPFRSIVAGALIPTFLFEAGVGAAVALMPSAVTDAGGSLATAGLVAAFVPVGKIIGDIPAGLVSVRLGDRRAMIIAAIIGSIALFGLASTKIITLYSLSALFLGIASSVFALARHSYLTIRAAPRDRGRVMSTLGGVHRVGFFVGPFIAASLVAVFSISFALKCFAVLTLGIILILLALGQDKRSTREDSTVASSPAGIASTLRKHRAMFLRLGTVLILIGIVRGSRQYAIPLWGEFIESDPVTISLVFGISGFLDALLFYPGGKIMDAHGRFWVAIPSMLLMGLALGLFPLSNSVEWFIFASSLAGFGNGLGAGLVMTIGADVSPEEGRSEFLSIWRLFQDMGEGAGPLLLALAAGAGVLGWGLASVTVSSWLASAGLLRWGKNRPAEH